MVFTSLPSMDLCLITHQTETNSTTGKMSLGHSTFSANTESYLVIMMPEINALAKKMSNLSLLVTTVYEELSCLYRT